MPLPLTVSCFSKNKIGLPFWYRRTRAVSDRGLLNARACVCVSMLCSVFIQKCCVIENILLSTFVGACNDR